MASSPLSIEALPGWARLNDVKFVDVKLQHIEGKGIGLVATRDLDLDPANRPPGSTLDLLKVPHELVLTAELVENYAKVDHNFEQLLAAAGRENGRGDIMLFLITHLILLEQSQQSGKKSLASNPWTEYLKFLSRDIPVPTLWSESELSHLQGTSLESAVQAKMASLNSEVDQLREKTSGFPFWNSLLWENEAATRERWILADALFRSRCIELPHAQDAMVPSIDMANHSHQPNAYYEETRPGDVELRFRPGSLASVGDEVTISYGKKPAAEMLFSYGFVDSTTYKPELTIPLEVFTDDPLAQAKLHIYEAIPTIRLCRLQEGGVEWKCPFVHLMCLNEEDGLEFRVLQDKTGGRQLTLLWQGEDVTTQIAYLSSLTQEHPLHSVFQLRAVTVISQQVANQLERLQSSPVTEESRPSGGPDPRAECVRAAEALRGIEGSLLKDAVAALEQEVRQNSAFTVSNMFLHKHYRKFNTSMDCSISHPRSPAAVLHLPLRTRLKAVLATDQDWQKSILLAEDHVKAYLGLTEDAKNEQASFSATNDEDFS